MHSLSLTDLICLLVIVEANADLPAEQPQTVRENVPLWTSGPVLVSKGGRHSVKAKL